MSQKGSVVIVGGGIIGVNCAWYLARSGWQVTVMDRKTIGGACSFGNCGLVCPSHVLPLTEPGAFKAAVKAMLTPGSPFRIQPRLDPALWSWMWQFSRRCNQKSMITAAHAIQALLVSSMREYETLVHVDKVECEWQAKGLMFAYQHERALDEYTKTDKLLAELFNEPAKRLNAEEAIALEPALKPSIAGAWLYEHDAHLRPDRLVHSMRVRLELRGYSSKRAANWCSLQARKSQPRPSRPIRGHSRRMCLLLPAGLGPPCCANTWDARFLFSPAKVTQSLCLGQKSALKSP